MKTKLFIIALLVILAGSCKIVSPTYLPADNMIGVNAHGSYIKVTTQKKESDKKGDKKGDKKSKITTNIIKGELIAIDTNSISLLTDITKQYTVFPLSEIKKFTVQYAQPKHYEAAIALFPLITAAHGVYALITLPLNLIVTIAVTSSGHHAFEYNHDNMTYDKLRMFARFPQGIPPNVDTASLQ